MSLMVDTRCSWPECERLLPVLEPGMHLCWSHMRLSAEVYLKHIGRLDEMEQEAKSRLEKSEGWVYYVRVGELIKVGHSKVVSDRLKAYPPDAELLAVEPGSRALEGERHSRFGAFLRHGREWFEDNAEVRSWIAQVRSDNPEAWDFWN